MLLTFTYEFSLPDNTAGWKAVGFDPAERLSVIRLMSI